jgi:hypothetical protein
MSYLTDIREAHNIERRARDSWWLEFAKGSKSRSHREQMRSIAQFNQQLEKISGRSKRVVMRLLDLEINKLFGTSEINYV